MHIKRSSRRELSKRVGFKVTRGHPRSEISDNRSNEWSPKTAFLQFSKNISHSDLGVSWTSKSHFLQFSCKFIIDIEYFRAKMNKFEIERFKTEKIKFKVETVTSFPPSLAKFVSFWYIIHSEPLFWVKIRVHQTKLMTPHSYLEIISQNILALNSRAKKAIIRKSSFW